MFQTKENIEQTALELYSVGQEGALAEVLELFTGLSANEDSQLRQSVSGLSSKLAETVQAQVALFMKDGVISKAELDILNKCGVFKSVVALSREAGNTEAASVEAALGVSTHCIASDGLTEASSPAAQREFVQACSAI